MNAPLSETWTIEEYINVVLFHWNELFSSVEWKVIVIVNNEAFHVVGDKFGEQEVVVEVKKKIIQLSKKCFFIFQHFSILYIIN